MSSRQLPPVTEPAPLLAWLLVAMQPTNRTRVKQLLTHRQIAVNGAAVTRHDHPLKPGDRITVSREGAAPAAAGPADPRSLRVVHEDDAVVIIDKPAGLLTVATEAEKLDTAFVRLKDQLEARTAGGRPFVVHRLDRDTSGLLLFAKSVGVRDAMQDGWDAVEKTYLAVVEGKPPAVEGRVENYLLEGQGKDLRVRACRPDTDGARRAVSRYRAATTRGRYSLVEVAIETGRKHQIRVHLAGLRCPVVGDETYGATANPAGRLGLHAWRLAFDHPVTGARVEAESPLPDVLRRVVGV